MWRSRVTASSGVTVPFLTCCSNLRSDAASMLIFTLALPMLKADLMPKTVQPQAQTLTIAATGASGGLFCRALLMLAERDARIATVNFVVSDNALRVFAEEMQIRGRSDLVQQFLG